MPPKPVPHIGWIVHYTLGREAVRVITTRRAYTGAQGTEPKLDAVCAAIVVAHTPPAPERADTDETLLNLKVQLDGEDIYWAQGIPEGPPGARDSWQWPSPTRPSEPRLVPNYLDPEILKAAAARYYAAHPELDPDAPRALEFMVRDQTEFGILHDRIVEVIGHTDPTGNVDASHP